MFNSSHIWFHTTEYDIEEILENGLKLRLGDLEHYSYLGQGDMQFMKISFTNMDIDDNLLHRCKLYGCYIGFDNDWVNRNHISPVIYCHKDSKLTKVLKQVINKLDPQTAQNLCQYCVQYNDSDCYQGLCENNGMKLRHNEQEWRYIPDGYSQEYLEFDVKDVFAIYVTSKVTKSLLENQFPTDTEKIKLLEGPDIKKGINGNQIFYDDKQ